MSGELTSQTEVKEGRVIGLLEPGDLVGGKFRVGEKLAEGGMGIVYVATQEPIGRKVALKVMKHELVSDNASVKRFYREAVAVSRLHHPNTIGIIDYGETDTGQVYIVMEFLDGEPLSDILERQGGIPLARAVNITGQIARALVEAHDKGVIHRDLKPDNVFMSEVDGGDDFIKVLDFGIAKLQQAEGVTKITRMGYVCGTPEYMSPEQARGEELDGRTDLYALGVMLWEMLEGDTPFEAPTPLGIVLKHQTAPVPPLTVEVPESVKAFIYRAMSKDPAERPGSAEAFLDELLAACPANMEAYSTAAAGSRQTGRRLSSAPPHTPPAPIHTTDIALAPTAPEAPASNSRIELEDDYVSISSTEIPEAAPSTGRRALIGAVAAAAVCLIVGGVAAAVMLGDDKDPAAAAAAPAAPEESAPVLAVVGQPEGAEVFRDGDKIGTTPIDIDGEPGEALTLEVRKEGFSPMTFERTFPENGRLELAYMLSTAAPDAVEVVVDSDPEGARVLREGAVVGMTPHTFKLAPDAAPFEVSLELDGHETTVARVDASQGGGDLEVPLEAAKHRRRVAKNDAPAAKKAGRDKKAARTNDAKAAAKKAAAKKAAAKKADGAGKKDDKYKIMY